MVARLLLASLSLVAATKMCPSPSGFHPCDCIIEVESGSRAEEVAAENGDNFLRLYHANGTVSDIPHCPHVKDAEAAPDMKDPCALGWPHAAPMEIFSRHNESIVEFSAEYVVPDAPSTVASNILYYWIGLQDTTSSANPVIQPVLSYYPGSSENNWYFESWNCCPAGHKIKSTSVSVSGPGAVLQGKMHRIGDMSIITSTNEVGNSSTLIVSDSTIIHSWNWVDIALETYAVADCAEYSQGGAMAFDKMTLTNAKGDAVTPAWTSAPYIDGAYLNRTLSQRFTSCCGGSFDYAHWPRATMSQN